MMAVYCITYSGQDSGTDNEGTKHNHAEVIIEHDLLATDATYTMNNKLQRLYTSCDGPAWRMLHNLTL